MGASYQQNTKSGPQVKNLAESLVTALSSVVRLGGGVRAFYATCGDSCYKGASLRVSYTIDPFALKNIAAIIIYW